MTRLIQRIRFFKFPQRNARTVGTGSETPGQSAKRMPRSKRSGREVGRGIVKRLIDSMERMRQSTEKATLRIGDLLKQIVTDATHDDVQVRESIEQFIGCKGEHCATNEKSVSQVIHEQSAQLTEFVEQTRELFRQQSAFAMSAVQACEKINACADSVSNLTSRSVMLAFNIRIEASRMGEHGEAIAVVGGEMKNFANDVALANDEIKTVLDSLTSTMPKMKEQSGTIESQLTEFSEMFQAQLAELEHRTDQMAESFQETISHVDQRNHDIVQNAHLTLSELQFQDPMSQELVRLENEVQRLQELIETGSCKDEPTQLAVDTTNSQHNERKPGDIDLF